MKYRKKPVVVEAVPFYGGHISMLECAEFVGTAAVQNMHDATLKIRTLEGVMDVTPGDYIIKGVKDEFYPCKPDIFAVTYEPADEPPPAGTERTCDKISEAESGQQPRPGLSPRQTA